MGSGFLVKDMDFDSYFVTNAEFFSSILNKNIYASGQNGYAQFGNGLLSSNNSVILASSAKTWVDVACGYTAAFYIKDDGTLWGVGQAPSGDAGLLVGSSYLTQIGTDADWLSLIDGYTAGAAFMDYAMYGIKKSGNIYGWGLGVNINSSIPALISTGNYTHGANYNLSDMLFAIDSSKAMHVFGTSGQGGVLANSFDLTQQWLDISAGWQFLTAIRADGTVWSVGSSNNGYNLGNGILNYSTSVAIQVPTITNASQCFSGWRDTYIIKADGTLWGWGSNIAGELGIGDTNPRSTPVQISADTKWVEMHSSSNSVWGLKSDGSLWACGQNASGQLGIGNNISQSSFVLVSSGAWTTISSAGNYFIGLG